MINFLSRQSLALLSIMKWLKEMGCPWNSLSFAMAAKNGDCKASVHGILGHICCYTWKYQGFGLAAPQ